jgi:hypothetical protein
MAPVPVRFPATLEEFLAYQRAAELIRGTIVEKAAGSLAQIEMTASHEGSFSMAHFSFRSTTACTRWSAAPQAQASPSG